ncbi:hypothetical protein BSKO_05230 [Bryopsis sp. KO-2023]|nr:hypothetical protein BSKO_05230 [Bryopsis sp. KO-2023]
MDRKQVYGGAQLNLAAIVLPPDGSVSVSKNVQLLATPPSSMYWSSSDEDGVAEAKSQNEVVSEEEFYSAQSDLEELFGEGHIESEGMKLVQMKVLDGRAPTIIPPAAISTSLSLVLALPESVGAMGDWKKSISESSPSPGQADKVVGASFLVQRVRNKLINIQIKESAEEFTLVFKVPVAGMAPWVESYKKDGSLVEIKNRRDYRSGRACGQAMALANGVILIRVWNLGALPEVMWEESFDFGTSNKLTIDHRVFTLDGKKQGRQTSIGYRQNSV